MSEDRRHPMAFRGVRRSPARPSCQVLHRHRGVLGRQQLSQRTALASPAGRHLALTNRGPVPRPATNSSTRPGLPRPGGPDTRARTPRPDAGARVRQPEETELRLAPHERYATPGARDRTRATSRHAGSRPSPLRSDVPQPDELSHLRVRLATESGPRRPVRAPATCCRRAATFTHAPMLICWRSVSVAARSMMASRSSTPTRTSMGTDAGARAAAHRTQACAARRARWGHPDGWRARRTVRG